ncbi:hypothetical protein F2Q68_00041192 [Brassica cretica]|uniref:Uncharacterized protein n=1 Tax=Brassica cretica TaxID=69181 RepID=A0A8S9MPC2_BRACR|nr:hypothetical protein F2Q68_00041192 [Brassica cretica]
MSWSLLILVLREKANQSRLSIEMMKIDDTKKANDWCFSVNGLYHKAMIMHTNTLDDFSNTSGTEDFRQQNQLANSSLIQCDRQMGDSRANVIVLATSEKLLSVSIFYIANAAFILARLMLGSKSVTTESMSEKKASIIGASACLSDLALRRTTSAECFSVNGLYHKAMIMQKNTLDDFSNTSGTEDFQQQKQLANSSLIQCDRQMGHSRANVIVLATSEKLLSVSIFYIANAAFVLASLR